MCSASEMSMKKAKEFVNTSTNVIIVKIMFLNSDLGAIYKTSLLAAK
jgi:hypothetical protein